MNLSFRRVRAFVCAIACVLPAVGALAQNVRISGQVRDLETKAPVTKATVKIEGAGLAGRENSQLIRKVNGQGGYQFEVPAGSYDLWVSAPDFEETKSSLQLAVGPAVERNIELRPLRQSYAYRVETLPLPQQMIPEISGVSFTPKGRLSSRIVAAKCGCATSRPIDGGGLPTVCMKVLGSSRSMKRRCS
jgi:hypothetical protein